MKHNLVCEAFNVHLKHHVLESLDDIFNVMGYAKTTRLVIFEGLNALSFSDS